MKWLLCWLSKEAILKQTSNGSGIGVPAHKSWETERRKIKAMKHNTISGVQVLLLLTFTADAISVQVYQIN
jgi:hypothetical protein